MRQGVGGVWVDGGGGRGAQGGGRGGGGARARAGEDVRVEGGVCDGDVVDVFARGEGVGEAQFDVCGDLGGAVGGIGAREVLG